MAYAHKTWLQLKTDLLDRLGDSVFWTDDTAVYSEAGAYLQEAMRVWAAVAWRWKERVTVGLTEDVHWYDLHASIGTLSQSVLDQHLLAEIEYHFLEPLNLTTWVGTEQFTLADVVGALERRRNQFLMETGILTAREERTVAPPPADGLIDLSSLDPDPIDIRRVAWKSTANVFTKLWRDDEWMARSFSPDWHLTPVDPPESFSVALARPLGLQLIPPPAANGTLELIVVRNGATLNPAAGVSVGVPSNLAWVVKYGAMADLLGREGQSRDVGRAEYCEQRWQEGIQIARLMPESMRAQLDGKERTIDAVEQIDAFQPGWQNTAKGTPDEVVAASLNLFAVHPKPNASPHSLTLDVVRPAPVPSLDTDQVQLGPEELDGILDYAQHIAAFKQGGAEFAASAKHYQSFLRLAGVYNEKIRAFTKATSEWYDRTQREPLMNRLRDPGAS